MRLTYTLLRDPPPFSLTLPTSFREYCSFQGILDVSRIPACDRQALHQAITLANDDYYSPLTDTSSAMTAIVDTGCSHTCSNDAADFLPGTLQALPTPLSVAGIAGGLIVTHEGVVGWEVVDDNGHILPLHTKAFLLPGAPCRLLSPQSFFSLSSHNWDDHLRVYRSHAELHVDAEKRLTLPYDRNCLPRLTLLRQELLLLS